MHNGSRVSFCVDQWVSGSRVTACDPLFTLRTTCTDQSGSLVGWALRLVCSINSFRTK